MNPNTRAAFMAAGMAHMTPCWSAGFARGDFGEYLFREFFRTDDPRLYAMACNFGQVYRDIWCFTIPEASDGSYELGGARARQTEHIVCPIRSYRGAVLLAYLYGRNRRQALSAGHRAARRVSSGKLSSSYWPFEHERP